MYREERLERLVEEGNTLYTSIDIEEKRDGISQITFCIGLYLKKIKSGEYEIEIDKFSPEYPHPRYESQKLRKFKVLNDAVLYINNNYSKKFIDMNLLF